MTVRYYRGVACKKSNNENKEASKGKQYIYRGAKYSK